MFFVQAVLFPTTMFVDAFPFDAALLLAAVTALAHLNLMEAGRHHGLDCGGWGGVGRTGDRRCSQAEGCEAC